MRIDWRYLTAPRMSIFSQSLESSTLLRRGTVAPLSVGCIADASSSGKLYTESWRASSAGHALPAAAEIAPSSASAASARTTP